MEQIEQVIQQNTANAEESAAAEELSGRSAELREMLPGFKLVEQSYPRLEGGPPGIAGDPRPASGCSRQYQQARKSAA